MAVLEIPSIDKLGYQLTDGTLLALRFLNPVRYFRLTKSDTSEQEHHKANLYTLPGRRDSAALLAAAADKNQPVYVSLYGAIRVDYKFDPVADSVEIQAALEAGPFLHAEDAAKLKSRTHHVILKALSGSGVLVNDRVFPVPLRVVRWNQQVHEAAPRWPISKFSSDWSGTRLALFYNPQLVVTVQGDPRYVLEHVVPALPPDTPPTPAEQVAVPAVAALGTVFGNTIRAYADVTNAALLDGGVFTVGTDTTTDEHSRTVRTGTLVVECLDISAPLVLGLNGNGDLVSVSMRNHTVSVEPTDEVPRLTGVTLRNALRFLTDLFD